MQASCFARNTTGTSDVCGRIIFLVLPMHCPAIPADASRHGVLTYPCSHSLHAQDTAVGTGEVTGKDVFLKERQRQHARQHVQAGSSDMEVFSCVLICLSLSPYLAAESVDG